MNRMRIPQTYYPRESMVHRVDPRVKLVLLVVLTVAAFVVATWWGLGVLAVAVAVVLVLSKLPLGVIARSLIPLYVLMAFAVVVNSFTLDPAGLSTAYGVGGVSAGVFEGAAPIALVAGWYFTPAGMVRSLFYCVRILCMVVGSLVVAYSTPATRLTEGLAWFMRPLERLRVPVNDIALTFTLALRFIGQNKDVSVVIPGMYDVREIEQNLAAMNDNSPLTQEELAKIEQTRAELGTQFCRRCNYCQPCTAGVNISGVFLMEGYLKRYGLGDWAKARYATFAKKASDCVGCGVCETRCPYQLPIREMLARCAQEFGA